jgi:2',3'-cyclic-nucleotide 2'-phosphodiesterase (5'-nucleotidase family)
MSPTLAIRMAFTKGEQNYLDLINQTASDLRRGSNPAQVVVVMSELGIHKDKQLADKITPGLVDVFFSAHTHELTMTPLMSKSGAFVVEAGNDTYLGRMDIGLDQNNTVVARNWTIIPLEDNIIPDSNVSAIVANVRKKYLLTNPGLTNPSPSSSQTLNESIATVLTTTDRMIARHHVLENSFNNLMTDLIKAEAGTDIALTRGFRFGAHVPASGMAYEDSVVLASGEITIEDVYRFIPVPYTLSTGGVTGLRLKEIIEQNLSEVFSPDAFSHMGGWFDGYSGLSMTLDVSQPNGNRLQSLSLNQNGTLIPIQNNDKLTITGCVRPFDNDPSALCAYTGFTNVTPFMNSITGLDFLIDALKNKLQNANFKNTLDRVDISDKSTKKFWPESEFVQPINGVP